MASSDDVPLPAYFAQVKQQGGIVVTDVPKLDLDSYIQNYRGRTRFDRLFLIARTSTVLSLDAANLAIQEAKVGRDVQRYCDACELLRALSPQETDANFDKTWFNLIEKDNRAVLHRLETELKGYKNNLVKESIRMGNEDLGKFLETTGELNMAYEAYAKMRADVSTAKHIIEVGMHLARIAVYRRDWAAVIANVNKINGLQSEGGDKALQSSCNVLYGITLLCQAKYADAAANFLEVDPSVETFQYDHFASPNDVAIYGGLLALATMERSELSRVLDNSSFRTFLELEPHIRRAISQFVNGRYSACLAILESHRSDYLLDIYLKDHVNQLYGEIRSKCIYHFLQPFSCAMFDSMDAAFARDGDSIKDELADMIRNGGLQARIDAIDKLVTTGSTNPRAKMQAASLAAANNYEKEALDRIRRIGIMSADLEVKGKQKSQGATVGGMPMTSARWADGPGEEAPDGFDTSTITSFLARQA